MNTAVPFLSTANYLLILVLSFVATISLWIVPEVQRYWQSAFRNSRIFLLLLLTMSAPFIGGARSFGGGDGPDIVRLIRFVVIIAIFLISLSAILKLGKTRTPMGASAKWMIAYALFCMGSALYSIDPVITAWKSLEILSLVLASIYICSRINSWDSLQDVLNMLCLLIVFFCVSTLVGALIAPSSALVFQTAGFSLRGLAPAINSNSVSQWGILLATITLAKVLSKHHSGTTTSLWLLFGLGMLVAVLGHSRTALFAGAVAIIVILIYGRHYKTATFTITTVIVVMLIGSLTESVTTYVTRGQDAELFLSMSNRTYFWEKAINIWSERPLLGYGFYSGQRVMLGWSTVDSAYIEVALGIGIIGLVFFVAAPVSASLILLKSVPRKFMQEEHTAIWLQLMSILAIILLRSFTSTSFSGLHPNTILFVITAILISSTYRLLNSKTHDDSKIEIRSKENTEKLRYIKKKR